MDKKLLLIVISTIYFLSACSGGGGESGGAFFDDGSVVIDSNGNIATRISSDGTIIQTSGSSSSSGTPASSKISIAISLCNTYTPLQASDAVIKDSTPTILKVNSYSDGTKEICLVSGSAHILR